MFTALCWPHPSLHRDVCSFSLSCTCSSTLPLSSCERLFSQFQLWVDSLVLLSVVLCVHVCLSDRQWNVKSLWNQSANVSLKYSAETQALLYVVRGCWWTSLGFQLVYAAFFFCRACLSFLFSFFVWSPAELFSCYVDQKVHPRQRWSLIPSSYRLKRQSGAIPCSKPPMVCLAQMLCILFLKYGKARERRKMWSVRSEALFKGLWKGTMALNPAIVVFLLAGVTCREFGCAK